ncbi:MAG: leucine-rich repeat protein, partial [Lachnospira sp.]|nr:leucine-rich repeat protein [Lachnospira sp.]
TAEPFAGTESYRSGGIKHERPLSIKGVTATMVKEIKYLPTYPGDTIALGYAEDSLKTNTRAEKIVLPECITTLKSGFLELTTLQDINLEHVVTIAANTFQGCTALEEADLSSAKSIGEAAFKDNENLEITAFHPDTQLSENTFENACTGSVKLPENLKSVPALCFQNSRITEVQLPDKLETIKTGAFYKTSSLTQITIPDSVTHIFNGAFRYSGLQSIDIHAGTEEMVLAEQAFGNCKDLIHVSFRLKNKESAIQIDGAFSDIAEGADYKVSCQINNSKNQLFEGAYNNPDSDYLIHTGLGAAIRYIGSITLNANGGSIGDTAIVYGREYRHLPTPVRQGYRFTGWYDGETKVENGDEIPLGRGDITLTARWEEKAGEGSSSVVTQEKASIIEEGGHQGVTSWETLSNQPIYYQNDRLKTTFITGDIYESKLSSFSVEDKINAERLFNQIYNTPNTNTYTEVVLNPKGVTLNTRKYKKCKTVDTGLNTDSFIRAVTLMNVMYFQNLTYMHKMKNDFLSTEDKLVRSYNDLLVGITFNNYRDLWEKRDVENNYFEYTVGDFEEGEVNDGKLHYEIGIDIFKQYYSWCRKIDKELDHAAQAIGLNQNTNTITVADAVTRINTYIHDNFAYDHFYKSRDLYWFFQPDNPQSPDMAELLRYYHDNEGDNKRNHHGICQSYAFFACALFAKYGCAAPGYENGEHTHIFNRLSINGAPLYIDYCWNADVGEKINNTTNLFLDISEMDFFPEHARPNIASQFQTRVDFNAQYPKMILKKPQIYKVKNKSGNKVILQYKKVTGAEKYQIQYSQNKSFTKVKSLRVKGNKVTIKNLKRGKTYYFRVRAYKSTTYMKSIKMYGKWSKKKKLKIRK